jgi:glutamate 5-kinase
MAGATANSYASGGMVTKLAAAKIAVAAGCRMAIADGRAVGALGALAAGGKASWFLAEITPMTARKRWIRGSLKPRGSLTLDAGAQAALKAGKSLLPAGVIAVEGGFERGDLVLVLDAEGREVARGLSAYGAADALRIKGHRSREIEALIGYRGREELIHRDDLVLTGD